MTVPFKRHPGEDRASAHLKCHLFLPQLVCNAGQIQGSGGQATIARVFNLLGELPPLSLDLSNSSHSMLFTHRRSPFEKNRLYAKKLVISKVPDARN
jgi:hypothetical protein